MKYIYTFLLLACFSSSLFGKSYSYQWSNVTRQEKSTIYDYTISFFDAFNKKEFQKIKALMAPGEISNRGRHWMSAPRFMYLVSAARDRGPLNHEEVEIFTFDDCKPRTAARAAAISHLHVFDNNSVVAATIIKDTKNGKPRRRTFSLVYQKQKISKKWKIVSVYGLNEELDKKELPDISKKKKGWRNEEINQLGLTLLIPPDFSHRKFEGNTVSWSYLRGKDQEAVIQVMAAKSRRSSLEEGRRWLRLFLKNRRYTTVRVMLLPRGYVFDLEMIDRDAKKNKVIIAALKKKRHTVFVAYIGYLKRYERMYRQVDFMMKHLLLE